MGYLGPLVSKGLQVDEHFKKVKDQITFHGHITNPDGFDISKICKIGICLKNQPEAILVSHERKFFEYMAIGLPMITCNSHIYKNVIDEYKIGQYVDLENANAIADVMKAILSNEQQLKLLSNNCIQAAETKFNWESQEAILLDTYLSLVNNS